MGADPEWEARQKKKLEEKIFTICSKFE